MNTALCIGGCILGYLLLGVVWARTQAVRLQKWLTRETKKANFDSPWGCNLEAHLLGHALMWPLILFGHFVEAVLGWTMKPVEKQRERVAGLRARADKMAEMLETLPSEEDRRILAAVIAENRKLAKELNL